MRSVITTLCLLVLTSLTLADNAPTTAPATKPADATLKVVSVRVNRSTQELQKKFRNRYSSDGSPGVQMQSPLFSSYYNPDAPADETIIQFMLPQLPEKPTVTVKYFEKVESVTLPFELSTTLGL